MPYLLLATFLLVIFTYFTVAIPSSCHCLPNEVCWPDSQTWQKFNESVGGQLLASNISTDCSGSKNQSSGSGCSKITDPYWQGVQGAFPVFAVNATGSSDIQQAVSFAAKHNLRLIVKNTGHDFLGRSTAPGSLCIWTQHLTNISFHDKFNPEGCSSNHTETSAVTVGAGVRLFTLYKAASERGLDVVGGADPSVGAAGGFVQGGGHGPLSPKYGLSADNVLQYTVVTADGKLRVANECQNQDIFWALRGGGGGTYGVVVSATFKTYKAVSSVIGAVYSVNATDNAAFNDLLKEFIKAHPAWSEAGWSGYAFITGDRTMAIIYLLPGGNLTFANESFASFESFAKNHQGLVIDGFTQQFPSFFAWYRNFLCLGNTPGCDNPFFVCSNNPWCAIINGTSSTMGSRLIPMELFKTESGINQLSSATSQIHTGAIIHLVAGGRVAQKRDDEVAVNPAWRKALWHLVFSIGWNENATLEEKKSTGKEVTNLTKVFRDITPGSGCYTNEADPHEPDWQEAYFGSNYPRLKKIKRQVDPSGLFTCLKCVGSEDWSDDLNCRKNS
ncbi:uncharacterized protein VTP21DRAFT_7876 [Calcarisporiella thermophila]|uniref:uncharacterized protein n=1 Tax=Calcarisporiella thermophila TaxID=911321 RepID=UPI00374251F2